MTNRLAYLLIDAGAYPSEVPHSTLQAGFRSLAYNIKLGIKLR
jgi:hypothetical protein